MRMRVTIYQQYPCKPHKGLRITKPKPIVGDLTIDEKHEAFLYENLMLVVAPVKVLQFSVYANGIFIKGVQSDNKIRFWYQEWFISGNILVTE